MALASAICPWCGRPISLGVFGEFGPHGENNKKPCPYSGYKPQDAWNEAFRNAADEGDRSLAGDYPQHRLEA